MQLQFDIRKIDFTEILKYYIERRLHFTLARFGDRVGQVSVRISGGASSKYQFSIGVDLRPFGRVAVQEVGADLFAAIDRATGRIGPLLNREVKRRRDSQFGRESIRLAV